jgi:hypothetical protein
MIHHPLEPVAALGRPKGFLRYSNNPNGVVMRDSRFWDVSWMDKNLMVTIAKVPLAENHPGGQIQGPLPASAFESSLNW